VPSRLPPPGPAELIRIRELLRADEDGALSSAALRERDRTTGRELSRLAPRPLAQIMAWYDNHPQRHARIDSTTRGLIVTCMLLGVAAGAITAFASFFYDGGQRVNVLLILALFCVLPLLSIVVFVIAALSRDGLSAISSGQFGAIIARVAPGAKLAKIAGLAAGDAGPGMSKWLLLGWSQWLGLGYGTGALCAAMGLVLFTDLAFGWSTTLELSSDTLSGALRTIAWPWHAWLPQAVPDEALIKISRYFRLSTSAANDADPIVLARWWPFVVISMLCYGVLPRLITLIIAHRRLRAACAYALLADGHVLRLLQRMNTPLVRTDALQSEHASASSSPVQVFADLPAAGNWQLINWAAVPVQQTAFNRVLGRSQHHAQARDTHAAGGTRSSAQDAALIAQLSNDCSTDDTAAVLIIAKSWEPPTLELMDFIDALRTALPDRTVVALMPVAVVDGAPAAPGGAQQSIWQHALGQAQLPNVHAVALQEQSA